MTRNAWTQERRARAIVRINEVRPWEQSTGPRTRLGKKKVSQNARRQGSRRERARLRAVLRGQEALLADLRRRQE